MPSAKSMNLGADHTEVEIQPLSKRHLHRAAVLCYEAFQDKFTPILGSPAHGVMILETDLQSDLVIAGVTPQGLVGLAGLEYDGHYFFNPQWATFAREFGLWRGLLRCMMFLPFAYHRRTGELVVGALAVDRAMRGKGIGTRLMEAVFDWARARGFRSVSLEVVDTNLGARRLYERLGFVAVGTRRCPYVCRRLGFSAVTMMVKEVM